MRKTFGGLGVLIGIVCACVGGYFLLKKYKPTPAQNEEVNESKEAEEKPSKEMPLRGSESHSKTSLEEPLDLESYKDFLARKTAYAQSKASEEIKSIFKSKSEDDKLDDRFLLVNSSYDNISDNNNSSYYHECVLLYEEGDDLVLKNEELDELDSSDVGTLKEFLRHYCRVANGSDWTEIYVLDTFMNTVYYVNRMDE